MSVDHDYDDLLNQSFEDLQDDKPLPVGRWLLRVRNAAILMPKKEGQSMRVLIFYQAIEPMDDVDSTELAELGDDYDYAQNDIVATFWVEGAKDMKKVFRHLQKHSGVDFDAGAIPAVLKKGVKGAEVTAYLEQQPFEDEFGETRIDNVPKQFERIE